MHIYQILLLSTAVFLATAAIMTKAENNEISVSKSEPQAWSHLIIPEKKNGTQRLLRTESTVMIKEEDASEEERGIPETATTKRVVSNLLSKIQKNPELEKIVNDKQLLKNKENTQFLAWFVTGRTPEYVRENILMVNPLKNTGKGIATYWRYFHWFHALVPLRNPGITFHVS
ncbi:hypothetical protein PHMEG_00016876 [Phytophthora megakarya]|uniref:RxLR effector protein n=1 Tax=Phytophthora megakarya TaxID=4795 RepID=A0A225VY63_9STRA|nr:hypothetical protein PHMEG_00016876 [Phytophthora megakarya]